MYILKNAKNQHFQKDKYKKQTEINMAKKFKVKSYDPYQLYDIIMKENGIDYTYSGIFHYYCMKYIMSHHSTFHKIYTDFKNGKISEKEYDENYDAFINAVYDKNPWLEV